MAKLCSELRFWSVARLWARQLAIALISVSPLLAQQPSETRPGFRPNEPVESRGVDNVNVFNGDPGVVIPLGPAYPLGPANTWQLAAYVQRHS